MNILRIAGLLVLLMILLVACSSGTTEDAATDEPSKENESLEDQGQEDDSVVSEDETGDDEIDFQTEAEANAKEYQAKPGAMLYDKAEEKFKGMNYHFKGELIKIEKVEGLFGDEDAFLVKNGQDYVMPIFPPYEISASEGDEIEAWGPLSGDGYASSDLGVDNVVGVAGAMNATRIDMNGEMQ